MYITKVFDMVFFGKADNNNVKDEDQAVERDAPVASLTVEQLFEAAVETGRTAKV